MAHQRIAVQTWGDYGGLRDAEAVRVRLLGGFGLAVGSRNVTEDFRRLRKAGALIKLLALARGHGMHRDRITALLWPNLGAKPASNNLHRTLHDARGALGGAPASGPSLLLRLGADLVELCPKVPLWIDVEAFEDAAFVARRGSEPAAYRAALDLYAGELLPGDLYEPWAEAKREELHRLYVALLVDLGHLHEQRKEVGQAVEVLQQAAAEEPADEVACAGLMRLYAAGGRRHEAILRYERLRRTLSEELGARPTDATRRLCDRILSGESPAAPAGYPPGPSGPATGAPTSNLPVPLTSFIGRQHKLVEVKRSLSMTRLLTLTGGGGSGKTRLALEVARHLTGSYPDGVWLAELAPISDATLVPRAVAAALGVREQPERALSETLCDHLGAGRALLVLDNCEHLVDAAARLAKDLLGACPRLTVLATSREALGVPGETVWAVPPLSLPDPKAEVTVEALMRTEAARLFVDRAGSRLPDFELTPNNAPVVARICRELDGIPLAIELSTARMGALAVEQVAERLAGSLGFLTGGDRTAPPRHQTLRATLDWSYALLSEAERSLFGRLSVFAGGWTLEAAEAVGAGRGIEREEVLDLLSRLVDKSVVVVGPAGDGGLRYGMLEPVRQYGLERLGEAPAGEADAARRRHASWYFGLAQEVEPWLRGGRREAWLGRLEKDYGNLRSALNWAFERGETDPGLWFGAALAEFWYMSGDLGEGRRWLEAALAKGGRATPARSKALARAGWIAWEQGDYEKSVARSEESLALSRELGDEAGAVAALSSLSWAALLGDDLDRASALSQEAVGLARTLGDAGGVARALLVPGLAAVVRQDYERAVTLHEESLRLSREAGDGVGAALSLGTATFAFLGLGDGRRAQTACREAFDVSPRPPVMLVTTFTLHASAALAGSQGLPVRSARLWGAAESLRGRIGAALSPVERRAYAPHIAAARVGVGADAWDEAWTEGGAMTAHEAVEYAVAEGEERRARPGRNPALKEAPSIRRRYKALTRREREVGSLIARGLTNRQIAHELTISERTVTTHVGRILNKLEATSRAQVATWIVEQRLLPEQSPG